MTSPSSTNSLPRRLLRQLLLGGVRAALRNAAVRGHVVRELSGQSPSAFPITCPLTHGLSCLLPHRDAVHSFSEIFVTGEYGGFLARVPLPRRWLDLGCHLGYFSLNLAWQHALRGQAGSFEALLVDADPRVIPIVRDQVRLNFLENRLHVRHGAIGEDTKPVRFAMREGMGSSASDVERGDAEFCEVPVLPVETLVAALPPPYDVIKVDIEGGETDLLHAYEPVLAQTQWMLMEWHTWNRHGLDQAGVRALVESRGFAHVCELKPPSRMTWEIGEVSCGIDLYRRAGA